jgi:hypothetical protein
MTCPIKIKIYKMSWLKFLKYLFFIEDKIRIEEKVNYYEDELLFKIKNILSVTDDNDILPYMRKLMDAKYLYREKDEVKYSNFSLLKNLVIYTLLL